jgi:hypothetical protein
VDELTLNVLKIKESRVKDPWAPCLCELTGEQTKVWGEGIWLNIRRHQNEMKTKAAFVARRVGMGTSMGTRTILKKRLSGRRLNGIPNLNVKKNIVITWGK